MNLNLTRQVSVDEFEDDIQAYKGNLSACQDFSQRRIRIFFSGTFTDTIMEREYITKNVYRDLKYHYRGMGLDFGVIDLRWGLRDITMDDHMTSTLCIDQVEKGRKGSIATLFIFLSGDKYGWSLLPSEVKKEQFEEICENILIADDRAFVNDWYKLDTNWQHQVYALERISSKIPNFLNKDSTARREAKEEWFKVEAKLQQILRPAVRRSTRLTYKEKEKWEDSVTEQELKAGLLQHKDKALCFMRSIIGLPDQNITGEASSYLDLVNKEINVDAQNRLKDLRERVKVALGDSNVKEYTVKWSEKGLNLVEHRDYVEKLARDMKQAIIDKIGNIKVPHPHTTELLAHGHMCHLNAKMLGIRYQDPSVFEQYYKGSLGDSLDTQIEILNAEIHGIVSAHKHLTRYGQQLVQQIIGNETVTGIQEVQDDTDSDEDVENDKLGLDMAEKLKPLAERLKQKIKLRAAREENTNDILVLHGRQGVGKRAVVAKAALALDKVIKFRSAVKIIRFCGTTPNSATCFHLVESICYQLKALYPEAPIELPTTYHQIIRSFPKFLALATESAPIVLILDSLDSLNDDHASDLAWIPIVLPQHVYFVVSVRDEGKCHQELLRRKNKGLIPLCNFYQVKNLHREEVTPILENYMRRDLRTLSGHQQCALFECAKANADLLSVRLLYSNSIHWRTASDTHMPKENRIEEMVSNFFDRIMQNHDEKFVSCTFGLLAASRSGLSESELLDIISSQDDVLDSIMSEHRFPVRRAPSVLMLRLRMDCGEYLIEKGAHNCAVLAWHHRQFVDEAEQRFLAPHRVKYMELLAEYFLGHLARSLPDRAIAEQPNWFPTTEGNRVPNLRKLSELPHALLGLEKFGLAVNELACIDWIEATATGGMIYQLISDLTAAIRNPSISESDHKNPLQDTINFLEQEANTLNTHPYLTFQQALNLPDTSSMANKAHVLAKSAPIACVEWIDKPTSITYPEVTFKAHYGAVNYCRYIGEDLVVTCSADRTVRIWSVSEMGRQKLCFREHDEIPTCCDVKPSNRNIIASASCKQVIIWQVKMDTSKSVFEYDVVARMPFLNGKYESIPYLCKFSEDSSRLLTASSACFWPGNPPGCVTIWDAKTWKCIGISIAYAMDRKVVDVSPDLKLGLVRHDSNNTDTFPDLGSNKLELWDLAIPVDEEEQEGDHVTFAVISGQMTKIVENTNPKRKFSVVVQYCGMNGNYFIPFGYLKRGHQKCKDTWPLTEKITFEKHLNGYKPVVAGQKYPFGAHNPIVSPKQTKLLGWKGSIAYVWEYSATKDRNLYFQRLTGHSADITHASFSPCDDRIVTSSKDQLARIWKVKDNVGHLDIPDRKHRTNAQFYGNNQILIIQENVLETHSGVSKRRFQSSHILHILVCAVDTTGALAVTSGMEQNISMWDMKSGTEIHAISLNCSILAITISPKNDYIVASTTTQQVLLCNIKDRKLIPDATCFKFNDNISVIKFSPENKYIVLGTTTGELLVDTLTESRPKFNNKRILFPDLVPASICCIQFSSSDEFFACGDECGTIFLCDISALRVVKYERSFVNKIDSIVFSFDDSMIFVASIEEKRIRTFDARERDVLVDYIVPVDRDILAMAVDNKGGLVIFDDIGKKYTMELRHMRNPSKLSIHGHLNSNIKPTWDPDVLTYKRFEVGKELLTQVRKGRECPTSQYWVAKQDDSHNTTNHCAWFNMFPSAGSEFRLERYLPASTYEATFKVKVTQGRKFNVFFKVDGLYVTTAQRHWPNTDQNDIGYVDVKVGTFVVHKTCLVSFKFECELCDTGDMSSGYWIDSIFVQLSNSYPVSTHPKCIVESNLVGLGDKITFEFKRSLTSSIINTSGIVKQIHLDKFLVEVGATDRKLGIRRGERFIIPKQSIVALDERNQEPKGIANGGKQYVPILAYIDKTWSNGNLYAIEPEFYTIELGSNKVNFPQPKTDIVENITPLASQIKKMDMVLYRLGTSWEEAIVVEIINYSKQGESLTSVYSDTQNRVPAPHALFCLHVSNGDEVVTDLRSLRVWQKDKVATNTNLASTLVFANAFSVYSKADKVLTEFNVDKAQFEQTVQKLFEHADINRSGTLSKEEVKQMSEAMGVYLTRSAWNKVFKSWNMADAEITKEQLVHLFGKWYDRSVEVHLPEIVPEKPEKEEKSCSVQ